MEEQQQQQPDQNVAEHTTENGISLIQQLLFCFINCTLQIRKREFNSWKWKRKKCVRNSTVNVPK